MTATLSPRLRVDNGVKIWWCGGQLLHIHPQENLYQAAFRPGLVSDTPPFPAVVPKAPEANASVAQFRPKNEESNGGESVPPAYLVHQFSAVGCGRDTKAAGNTCCGARSRTR